MSARERLSCIRILHEVLYLCAYLVSAMRLINAETFELKEFIGDQIPLYAILSHTWGNDEVSLQDMTHVEKARTKSGFRKIEFCCQQAREDCWEWVWVDTCCIDKTSSAELSEAINSMYRWYEEAAVCYVYLSDVHSASGLAHSIREKPPRWFTRGWTLQELIAPSKVVFFSEDWTQIGTKQTITDVLSSLTGIPTGILLHEYAVTEVSVARRMFWASTRSTTRVEDIAYCLLGIFDINMPLLYGEGKKAFMRLQEEILRRTDDYTLFLGGVLASVQPEERSVSMLSEDPSAFWEEWPYVDNRVSRCGESPRVFHDYLLIDLRVKELPDENMLRAALYCFDNDQQLTCTFWVLPFYNPSHPYNSQSTRLLPELGNVEWVRSEEISEWKVRRCMIMSARPHPRLDPEINWHGDYEGWESIPYGRHLSEDTNECVYAYLLFRRAYGSGLIFLCGLSEGKAFCGVHKSKTIRESEKTEFLFNYLRVICVAVADHPETFKFNWGRAMDRRGIIVEDTGVVDFDGRPCELTFMLVQTNTCRPHVKVRLLE